MLRALLICLGVVLFTWLGFEYFPGHTYLQSDTQIYLPILERLDNPGYLSRDLVATNPHVAYTIYDEIALFFHHTAHADFARVLIWQQLLFRAAAMFGVYLIASSAGLGAIPALLVAALFNLGASLLGPAVLLVEYEPIPRGYASGLIFLALGLLAQEKRCWQVLQPDSRFCIIRRRPLRFGEWSCLCSLPIATFGRAGNRCCSRYLSRVCCWLIWHSFNPTWLNPRACWAT